MQNASDLLTRWPALEVAAKRARLQHSLHVSPGPVGGRVRADAATAGRAAAAMWRTGYPFTFGTLELAQALGDFASLDAAGRRALHVDLPAADGRLVGVLADALLQIALQ